MVKKKDNFRHEITCCECGNVFRSVRSDARFCSAKCKKNASLRSIAMRKQQEEREFAIALEQEERQVSNDRLIALVSALQSHKRKIEVRNNGERLLREYQSVIKKRADRMKYERILRAQETERWKHTQERIQEEKARQIREYLQKVYNALESIRTHQRHCQQRHDRLEQLAHERAMQEKERQYQLELERERERRRIEREQRKQAQAKREQQRYALYGTLVGKIISSVICK